MERGNDFLFPNLRPSFNLNSYIMKLNYYYHFKDQQTHLTELDEIVNRMLHDEVLRVQTELYRAQRRKELKMQTPLFAVAARMEGGKAINHVTGLTGLTLVDVDDLTAEQAIDVRRRAAEDEHTLLAYVTLSGCGVRVVCRYELPDAAMPLEEQMARYRQTFHAVNDYYGQLLGVEADRQCVNATRLSGLAHDTGCVYRPGATPFGAKELEELWGRRTKVAKEQKRQQAALKRIAKLYKETIQPEVEGDGASYEPGRHNDYVMRVGYKLNAFGIPQEDALAWATQEFDDYGDCAMTIRNCYHRTGEHGTRRARVGRQGVERKAARASLQEVEEFVTGQCDLRYNVLLRQLEVSWKQPREGTPEGWIKMTDREENSLWCNMQRKGIFYELNHLRALLLSDFVATYHPLRSYLEGLEPWDGVTDYIAQLAGRVHCVSSSPALFADHFKRWLVNMLAAALDEQVANQQILTLVGRQGNGKTSFMSHILPPELMDYYVQKASNDPLSKDERFTLTEMLLVNLDDLNQLNFKLLDQLKALSSDRHLYDRPAYGRNKEHRPMTASFCATGNQVNFLIDNENRRWLVHEVARVDDVWHTPIPYAGIYAQAWYLLQHGFEYRFNEQEIRELNERNRGFEAPCSEREYILMHYRKPVGLEKGVLITASQVVARAGVALHLLPSKVGIAFKELGFTFTRTSNGRFWLVVERTGDEMNHLLPEPGELGNP